MSKVKLTKYEAEEFEALFKIYSDESLYKIANAIKHGYEVEPEYKVGDWVVYEYSSRPEQINAICNRKIETNSNYGYADRFRHATESEIAQEKERKWWSEHNRAPREIKMGDIITKPDGFSFTYDGLGVPILPKGHKVACFREDRLDWGESE